MASNQNNTLSTTSSPEVSIHLWPSGEERHAPDWRNIKSALMRRRALVLGVFFGTLLFCLLAMSLLPKTYRASATLQVNTGATYTNENDLPVLADLTGSTQDRSLVTQTEILNNDGVRYKALDQVDESLRGAADPSTIAVKAVPETDLVTISSSSRNPEAAAAMANALCKTFIELSRDKNRSQYSAARHYVGVQLQDTGGRLERARANLRRYKQQNGTVDLATETQQQIGELNRIQSEQRQASANREASLAQLAKVKSVAAGLPATIVASSTTSRRPEVVAMQARLTQLELQRIEALREFQPNSPEVQSIVSEIGGLRGRLRLEAQDEVASSQSSPNPVRVEADQTIARLQGEISSLEARNIELGDLAKRVQSNLARLPEREQRLGQLNTDIEGLQQSYQTLNAKYQTLRASEAARVSSGSLLFPATVPGSPVKRLTPINLILILALASMLAYGALLVAERTDVRIRSPLDLPIDQGVSVLAQIPFVKNTSDQCLINTRAMVSPLLENFRTLRFMVGHARPRADGKPPRLVVVTSSLQKEGKSLVSVNMAVAAALSGERVVLVDCDLRWPTLHTLCNRNNSVGFVNVANGEATLETALQSTRVPNLYILTSGVASANPFHTLNSPLGRGVLSQLSEIADLVVVDTPPAMVLADARLLASMADSVLLVVSTEGPDKEDVARATELLTQSGARHIGIVLNKVVAGYGFKDYYSLYPYYTPVEELTSGSNYSGGGYPSENGSNGNGIVSQGFTGFTHTVPGSSSAQ